MMSIVSEQQGNEQDQRSQFEAGKDHALEL